MDSIPLAFSERVAVTWKCCESNIRCTYQCSCVLPALASRKWTFSKSEFAEFHIGRFNGEWKYGFKRANGIAITMSELLRNLDFKKLRITTIRVCRSDHIRNMKPIDDGGMEKLLSFVSLLANEPSLSLFDLSDIREFCCPEGAMLLKWLEERWFSHISFWTYYAIYDKLLRKQASRRTPTVIVVHGVKTGEIEHVAEQLRSGQLTKLSASNHCFSHDVMEGIVQSFMRATSKRKVLIRTDFEHSTMARLMEMKKRGLCRKDGRKFIFQNQFTQLDVYAPAHGAGLSWQCISGFRYFSV